MIKTALLDGDSWVYRCGFAAEKTKYLVELQSKTDHALDLFMHADSYKEAKEQMEEGSILWSRKEVEPLDHCLQMVRTSLENTLNVLGAREYKVYLSGRRNFRDDIFPDYKANRDGASKPKYYRAIRDYLISQWGASLVEGYEADDAVGMDLTRLGNNAVAVAVDKDLDQIPGAHYNWVSGSQYSISPRDGMRFFYEQLLSGDPTDNIPGISGIGPVKSAKLLSECQTPQECAAVVYSTYRGSLGAVPDAEIDRNARLLWIWRKENDIHPFWRHLGRNPV